jgi:hypothetical protein
MLWHGASAPHRTARALQRPTRRHARLQMRIVDGRGSGSVCVCSADESGRVNVWRVGSCRDFAVEASMQVCLPPPVASVSRVRLPGRNAGSTLV